MVKTLKWGKADELIQNLFAILIAWLVIKAIKFEDISHGGFLLELEKDVQLLNSSIFI